MTCTDSFYNSTSASGSSDHVPQQGHKFLGAQNNFWLLANISLFWLLPQVSATLQTLWSCLILSTLLLSAHPKNHSAAIHGWVFSATCQSLLENRMHWEKNWKASELWNRSIVMKSKAGGQECRGWTQQSLEHGLKLCSTLCCGCARCSHSPFWVSSVQVKCICKADSFSCLLHKCSLNKSPLQQNTSEHLCLSAYTDIHQVLCTITVNLEHLKEASSENQQKASHFNSLTKKRTWKVGIATKATAGWLYSNLYFSNFHLRGNDNMQICLASVGVVQGAGYRTMCTNMVSYLSNLWCLHEVREQEWTEEWNRPQGPPATVMS